MVIFATNFFLFSHQPGNPGGLAMAAARVGVSGVDGQALFEHGAEAERGGALPWKSEVGFEV